MAKRIIRVIRAQTELHFPSLILYRDDIDAIVGMLQPSAEELQEIVERPALALSNKEAFGIYDEDHSYDSLEDLKQTKGDAIRSLTVTRREPFVKFDYVGACTGGVSLHTEPADEGRALFNNVRSILERAENRWWTHLPEYKLLQGAAWSLGGAFVVCMGFGVYTLGVACFVLEMLCFGLALLRAAGTSGAWSKAYLIQRHEVKKAQYLKTLLLEKIVPAIVLLILGGILTKGVEFTWAKLTTPTAVPMRPDNEAQRTHSQD